MLEGALEPLTPEARRRVLRWAADRYGADRIAAPSTRHRETLSGVEPLPAEHNDPGEFFARAAPETEPESALLIAYWVQEVEGRAEFDSQTVNTMLKHLGHGVSNITRALNDLKQRRPQLVIQIEKSGKSKQARKRYRVTAAGKAQVIRMVTPPKTDD